MLEFWTYLTTLYWGYYFEATNHACTFALPVPAFLLETSPDYVRDAILNWLCDRSI